MKFHDTKIQLRKSKIIRNKEMKSQNADKCFHLRYEKVVRAQRIDANGFCEVLDTFHHNIHHHHHPAEYGRNHIL